MDKCENKDGKELYVLEYKWIIEEQLLGQPDLGKTLIASTKFKSHKENYEWYFNLYRNCTLNNVLKYNHILDSVELNDKFYLQILCEKLLTNIFHEKKIEILIDSSDSDYTVNIQGCINYKENNSKWDELSEFSKLHILKEVCNIFLFDDKSKQMLLNDKRELVIVSRISEPFSTAVNNLGVNQLKVINDYEKLLKSGDHSDFKIVIGTKEFFVHKSILAVRSNYFAAMFKHETKEKTNNIVEISNVSHEVMTEILQYIYCEKVNISEDTVYDLITAADMYQLNHLKKECEYYLINNIKIDNVTECMVYADRCNNEFLKNETVNFFTNHMSEFNAENLIFFKTKLPLISSTFLADLVCRLLHINKE